MFHLILVALLATSIPTVPKLKADNAHCLALLTQSFNRKVDAFALVNKVVVGETQDAKYTRHKHAAALLIESQDLGQQTETCMDQVEVESHNWLTSLQATSQ